MLVWKRRKRTPLLGLDVGAANTKILEVDYIERPMVVAVEEFPTPKEALNAGSIEKKEDLIVSLAQVVERRKWRGREVVTTVGGHRVFIRMLYLPLMAEKELPSAVNWEAKKRLPFTNEEVVLDFLNLGEQQVEGQRRLAVLLAAVPRDLIAPYYQVCEVCGLRLNAVDIWPLALMRWFRFFAGFPVGPDKPVGILDIGAVHAYFMITDGVQILLNRVIPVAGQSLTETVASMLDLPPEKAENLKVSSGRLWRAAEDDPIRLQEQHLITLELAIHTGLDSLVQELRRSLDYQRVQGSRIQPEKILLSGGTSVLPGLPEFLRRELELDFKVVEVPEIAPEEVWSPRWAVAAGLSLRGVRK